MLSCTQDEVVKGSDEALPASLTFTLPTVGLDVDSRSFDNPASDPTTWTPMERAIDGREFYHVTLFLVNSKNTLVAYRDIYNSDVNGDGKVVKSPDIDSNNGFWTGYAVGQNETVGTQIKATFQYDSPKHGAIEKLVQGEYTLIAVANYSAYKDDTYASLTKYDGLKTNGISFAGLVTQIKTQFNESTGLPDFHHGHTGGGTGSPISSFFNYTLDAGADFICPKQPQPLTLVKKISLHPGNNVITGELKRTYARICINLSNRSGDYDLKLKSLSFNEKFTQRYAYLLEDPNNPDFIYNFQNTDKGAPSINSSDAIIRHDNTNPITLTKGENKVLFDAYVFESKSSASYYTYTLDVEYPDAETIDYSKYRLLNNSNPIKDVNSLAQMYDKYQSGELFFLMKHTTQENYLKDDDKIVGVGTISNLNNAVANNPDIVTPFLWILERNGSNTNSYRIKTKEGAKYMGGEGYGLYYKWSRWYYPQDNVALSTPKSGYVDVPLSFTTQSGAIDCFQSGGNNATYYIVSNKSSCFVAEESHTYHFYPVTFGTSIPKFNTPIQLQIIDPVTAKVSDLTNIKRNDFINIYINSSFNKTNSVFEFVVEPWNRKDIGIDFN